MPVFETFKGDTQAFARATEAYCGFKPGGALKTPDRKTIFIQLAEPRNATVERTQCLYAALIRKNLQNGGVRVFLTVQEAR